MHVSPSLNLHQRLLPSSPPLSLLLMLLPLLFRAPTLPPQLLSLSFMSSSHPAPSPCFSQFPSPPYLPPPIPAFLASLLFLRIRESGSAPILINMGLHCVSECVFLLSLQVLEPLGSWCLRSGCLSYF